MEKKKINKILLLFILILIVGCAVYIYSFYFKKDKINHKKQVDVIEGYDYKLYDTDSHNYKKLFYELKDILNSSTINEEEYVKTIAKMFTMDFYTLENKSSSNDIGGTDFVYRKVLSNFEDKAKDTVYLYLENNRDKELPFVEEVIVEKIDTTKYYYLDTIDNNSYAVVVSIKYKKDLGYDKEKTLYFVHEDKKLSLVEIA